MLFHAGRCRDIMDAMSAFRILRRGAAGFVANATDCGALTRSAASEGVFASSLDVR